MRKIITCTLLVQLALLVWVLHRVHTILDDIGNFFVGIGNDIASVVTSVWNALQALFHATEDVFGAVLDAWGWAWSGIVWIGTQIENVASGIVDGIGWFIFTAIPDAVDWAVRFAYNAVETAIDALTTLIKDTAQGVVDILRGIIDGVQWVLQQAIDAVTGVVNDVVNLLDTVGRFVFDLVTHPDKLVRWLWSAFVSLLLDELWALIRVVLKFIWDEIRSDIRGFLHTIEDLSEVFL